MKAFLKDNYAFVIISGQLFLSTAFLHVTINKNFDRMEASMETNFTSIKSQLTAINASLDRLEEGQRDIKESLASLEESLAEIEKAQHATIRLLERMDREYQVLQRLSHR